jgi:DNA-binding FadR family transcriptional regulator
VKRISAPRRTASLSAQLVDSLRSHIESGGWPVGTRIPAEQALMEELGVGRSTLREAIGALVHLGLLEARVGDGTYVRSSSELQSVMVRRAGSVSRDKVLELRSVLEEYASKAAAVRRSEEQLRQLRQLLDEADAARAAADVPAAMRVDELFHRTVVRASGNDLLIEVYDYLGTALTSSPDSPPMDATHGEAHARLHRRLVDAIEARDASGARDAAAAIIQLTSDHESDGSRAGQKQ